MPTRYDEDEDDLRDTGGRDREISLGTGTVLAIFLALALVCSLFFGLGYSMGRKSAPLLAAGTTSLTSSGTPERAAPRTLPSDDSASPSGVTPPPNQVTQPFEQNTSAADTATTPPQKPAAHDRSASAKPSPVVAAPLAAPVLPVNLDPASQTFVQVAAVSRKEDADLLLAALKRRGYTALIRQQSQDKLLHVQVGPFPSKKDAEAMRQRLITDGYNPILK